MFGGGNMQGMMKKVQKMQKDMKKMQDELKVRTVEATVGGGTLTIVMNGEKTVESVTIDPSVIDPEDKEMLEDLIVAAVNEAGKIRLWNIWRNNFDACPGSALKRLVN